MTDFPTDSDVPSEPLAEAPSSDRSTERATAASIRDDGAPADIDPSRLDPDGIKILDRLHRFDHEAYFVGGCVRDGLLDLKPKDFDVCTSAHPGQVRSLFRNCRLIGRRFRLAHVYFRGGKIIEVSTFRANPTEVGEGETPPEDLLITQDNVFGTATEDARRRDFTINGLFYDIQRGRVIDYVGGLADLRARTIRTIGDPETRMREDPVRLLRAVRFAAKLGFDFDPATYAAMEGAVEDLPRCAPARLLDDAFKILRSDGSATAFRLLDALGALQHLLPPVAQYVRTEGPEGLTRLTDRLAALDRAKAAGTSEPIDESVIIANLLLPLTEAKKANGESIADALLEEMIQTARLPRRIADKSRQLMWAQGVLLGETRRRRSQGSFRSHPIFQDALLFARLGVEPGSEAAARLDQWESGTPATPPKQPKAASESGAAKKKRRRRKPKAKGEAQTTAPAVEPPAE